MTTLLRGGFRPSIEDWSAAELPASKRVKRKLNAGEIGNDSGKLADRLIDDLLDK